ncbi:MAG TPA: SMC-Scp complex subunit ScpB [Candidatus Paceibacterota bacterium]|nr:SMC-Scp complex subunit ScpB [Candidatus Paceibacterota bacterium]
MALTPPAQLEALLFAAGEAMPKKRLASVIGVSPALLDKAIEALRTELSGRGLALIETEDAVELRTHADASDLVRKLRENELSRDLGKAGLETLALILYRGSATRSEIDWVRGVNSSQTLRSLLIRGLVERMEDPEDKRKLRYKATVDALAHLGVTRKEELPGYDELNALFTERQTAATAEDV